MGSLWREHGRVQITEQRFLISSPADPGSNELPERAHRPALSHHSLSALWGLLGQNLHLHSGELTFSPLEGAKIPSWLSRGLQAAPSEHFGLCGSDPPPTGCLSPRRLETPSWPEPSWSLPSAMASSPPSCCTTGTQRLPTRRKSSRAELATIAHSPFRVIHPPSGSFPSKPVSWQDLSFIPLQL